ncbi:MAG: hypothetical protein LBV29_05465, partial [Azoarcus sp.]|nr:hypothetical protein [Azoarcus sp.]
MRTSLSISFLITLSFLLGYARDLLVAWRYGGTWMADSFFVALLLPSFFENLLGITLRDAVIPYLYALRQKGLDILQQQFRRLQLFVWTTGFGVAAVVVLGATLWLKLLMPGWESKQISEFLWVFRLAGALIFVQTVLCFQTAVFNYAGRFVLPVTRTVLSNICAIGVLFYTGKSVGSVIAGILFGQFFLLAVMRFMLKKVLLTHHAVGDPLSSARPSLIIYLMPLLIVTFSQQICFVVERILCSYMAEGSIAKMSYAYRIAIIPMTLYIFSALSLIYPRLSLSWLRRQNEDFVQLLHYGVVLTLVFLAPAAVVLTSASSSVVTLLFQRGAFGPEQTIVTASLLSVYGFGPPAVGMTLFCGRILVLMGKGRQFAALAVLSALSIICIDIAVYDTYGVLGLAVSYVVCNWIQALISLILIARYVPTFQPWGSLVRWIGACLLVYCGVLITMTSNFGWMKLLLTCASVFAA